MKLKENNFFYLLAGLLITLLGAPIVSHTYRDLIGIAFLGTIVISVWSLHASKRVYILGWILAGASLMVTVADRFIPQENTLFIADAVVLFLFLTMTTVVALRQVLFGPVVDANRIAGAVAIYLMIGLSWGLLYALLYIFDTTSFNGLPSTESGSGPFLELLYYSYVTLTTLGYGDISPATPVARAFAYLEAVTGVMYLAILVAALVGAYAASDQRNQVEDTA